MNTLKQTSVLAMAFGMLLAFNSCEERKETKEVKKTETHETKKSPSENQNP